MSTKSIVLRICASAALLGAPLLALEAFAELDGQAFVIAQGNEPDAAPMPGDGASGGGTGLGPEDDHADTNQPVDPTRRNTGTVSGDSNVGDTSAHGRASHGGTAGEQRPLPSATP